MNTFRFLCAAIVMLAADSSVAADTPSQEQIYAALRGAWTGQLEYRDYSNDERVVLPTWLEVKLLPDGRSLSFEYTYDDGPTKTVKESSQIEIDLAKMRYASRSEGEPSANEYKLESAEGPSRSGRIRLTLIGTGTENDQKVDVRITITIDRNMYQFRKETRLAGKEFIFRDGYVLTRREPGE